jgi:hypothetical protein
MGRIDTDMVLIFLGWGISAVMLSGPDDSLLSDVCHILLQEPSMKQCIGSLNVHYRAVYLLTGRVSTLWLPQKRHGRLKERVLTHYVDMIKK